MTTVFQCVCVVTFELEKCLVKSGLRKKDFFLLVCLLFLLFSFSLLFQIIASLKIFCSVCRPMVFFLFFPLTETVCEVLALFHCSLFLSH